MIRTTLQWKINRIALQNIADRLSKKPCLGCNTFTLVLLKNVGNPCNWTIGWSPMKCRVSNQKFANDMVQPDDWSPKDALSFWPTSTQLRGSCSTTLKHWHCYIKALTLLQCGTLLQILFPYIFHHPESWFHLWPYWSVTVSLEYG